MCVEGVRETRGAGPTILPPALGTATELTRGEGRAGLRATWLATPT